MTPRAKWAGRVLVSFAILFALFVVFWLVIPFERCVLVVKHIELTGWSSYWDGGSRTFAFRLPGWRSMIVFVPHRNAALGGNPDFQEIWLGPNKSAMRQVCLKPGSALETHLLTLLRTAGVKENQEASSTNWPWMPTPNDLKWLAVRIQDRRSKW
jgi:hypothetical protein